MGIVKNSCNFPSLKIVLKIFLLLRWIPFAQVHWWTRGAGPVRAVQNEAVLPQILHASQLWTSCFSAASSGNGVLEPIP